MSLNGLTFENRARYMGESVRPDLWPDHAWMPAFGCQGENLFEICKNKHGILVNGSTWEASGVYTDGSDDYISVPNIGTSLDGKYLSIVSNITLVSIPATIYPRIIDRVYNGQFSFYINSSGNLSGAIKSISSSVDIANTSINLITLEAKRQTCAFIWDGTTIFGYKSGGQKLPLANFSGTGLASSSSEIRLGQRVDGTNRAGNWIYHTMLLYGRPISNVDLDHLSADPYLPFRRRMPVFYSVPSAGGAVYTLDASAGAIEITGTSAGLLKSSLLSADAGEVVITGSAAYLLSTKLISADAGAVEIFGTAAGLLKSSVLGADSGAVEISGADAALLKSNLISAGAGEITITGADASLFFNRAIQAESGDIDISGVAADLTYTPTGTTTLSAESGEISISGSAAGLLQSHILGADGGAVSITGTDALLAISRRLAADGGSVVVTGSDAAFLISHILAAGAGGVTITGYAATLDYSGEVIPHGLVIITFAAKVPSFSFTIKQPTITIQ